MRKFFVLTAILAVMGAGTSEAHQVYFKSPGPGMHFTAGQPLIVYADMFDDRTGFGYVLCPGGEDPVLINTDPNQPSPTRCPNGGNPVGWPQFQLLVDGVPQMDV